MKRITREDFRVRVVLAPRTPADLGLGDLPGQIVSGRIELVIAPKRLGDYGFVSMSDSLASRDIEGDYQRRCESIVADLTAQGHVASAEITWTETVTCSHCHYGWEELTAELLAEFPTTVEPLGLPMCCEEAQAEWRAEQAAKGGVSE